MIDTNEPEPALDEPSIDELERQAHIAAERLRKARRNEVERRTLGAFRDQVKDHEKQHGDLIERQTSYDTDSKARLFTFGAFDGAVDGSLVWVLLGSIYAVEKDPNENFTTLKTADGPLGVRQSPDEVFNEFTRIRFEGSAEAVRENQAELSRREDKVRNQQPITPTAEDAHEDATLFKGPDFQTVSDLVGADIEDDDVCDECGGGPFTGLDGRTHDASCSLSIGNTVDPQ